MFRGVEDNINIERLLDNTVDPSLYKKLSDTNMTMPANGALFDKGAVGFLPTLMANMYSDRSMWKKRMIEAKKKLELIEQEILRREA